MSDDLPTISLARHGETEWSRAGRHTGRTDPPLTARGEQEARALGARLQRLRFTKVLTSPLQRAARTCAIAGFDVVAEVDRDLVEWDYGAYEGLTSAEIRAPNPRWELFRDGCPDGESPAHVAARVDRVVARVRAVDDNVLVFSSGHLLRMLAARWLGLQTLAEARIFLLSTASLSALGYEHDRLHPVIRLWNDTSHVSA